MAVSAGADGLQMVSAGADGLQKVAASLNDRPQPISIDSRSNARTC
jgi:hypothetical protein